MQRFAIGNLILHRTRGGKPIPAFQIGCGLKQAWRRATDASACRASGTGHLTIAAPLCGDAQSAKYVVSEYRRARSPLISDAFNPTETFFFYG